MRTFFLIRLSKCEKDIMAILWSAGKSLNTNEVLEMWDDEPKPSYNTLATHLTRLSHKNFVEPKKKIGEKTFYYSPVVSRAKYQQRIITSVCLLVVVCLTAVAGIVISLPNIGGLWHDEKRQEVPKPVPVIKHEAIPDTLDTMPAEESIAHQPSLTAEYPGGEEAIQQFFEQHWQGENEGRVYLRVLIDSKGKVREANALLDPSTNPELAKEVEAIALTMPSWRPATEHGKPVPTRVTIPIILINE